MRRPLPRVQPVCVGSDSPWWLWYYNKVKPWVLPAIRLSSAPCTVLELYIHHCVLCYRTVRTPLCTVLAMMKPPCANKPCSTVHCSTQYLIFSRWRSKPCYCAWICAKITHPLLFIVNIYILALSSVHLSKGFCTQCRERECRAHCVQLCVQIAWNWRKLRLCYAFRQK